MKTALRAALTARIGATVPEEEGQAAVPLGPNELLLDVRRDAAGARYITSVDFDVFADAVGAGRVPEPKAGAKLGPLLKAAHRAHDPADASGYGAFVAALAAELGG